MLVSMVIGSPGEGDLDSDLCSRSKSGPPDSFHH